MDVGVGRARAAMRATVVLLGVGALAGLALHDDPAATSGIMVAPPTTAPPPALVRHSSSSGSSDPVASPEARTRATATVPASTLPPTTLVPTTLPASTIPRTTLTTTTAPPTTVPPSTLPETPIAPPLDTRGHEEYIELGSLSIPALDVHAPLLEGIRLTTLDRGPGHWPGTAMPGEVGNVVVAAHRTSHGAPFRHIDQLGPGDTVEFVTATGEHTYVVTGTQIVGPEAIWIVDQTDTPTATLFACHPPGSVRERIVVKLELAS